MDAPIENREPLQPRGRFCAGDRGCQVFATAYYERLPGFPKSTVILDHVVSFALNYATHGVIRKGYSLPSPPRRTLFDLESRVGRLQGCGFGEVGSDRVCSSPRLPLFSGALIVIAELVPTAEAPVSAEGSSRRVSWAPPPPPSGRSRTGHASPPWPRSRRRGISFSSSVVRDQWLTPFGSARCRRKLISRVGLRFVMRSIHLAKRSASASVFSQIATVNVQKSRHSQGETR